MRLSAVQSLCSRLHGEDLAETFYSLRHDPNMRVRRQILEAYIEDRGVESCAYELEEQLFDRHRSLRELSRYYLARLRQPPNIVQSYRQRLTHIGD